MQLLNHWLESTAHGARFVNGKLEREGFADKTPKAVKDLDEFLDFLEQLEKVFGSIERAPQITKGDRFLL